MFGSGLPWAGRWAVAFLGIRGMGSIYYLSYGQNHADYGDTKPLWAAACFTILLSIVVHGMVADWIMKRLEKAGANVVPGTEGDVLAERESAA
jgi:NhaP-type Na+/H+ or K+/H+ antiporter